MKNISHLDNFETNVSRIERRENMPTGYTARIENDEITTGKEFLRLCTRAFGIAIDVKDEPLSTPTPSSFELSPFYKESYDRALKKLEEANKMTFDEAKIQMRADYEKRISDYKRCVKRETAMNKKYAKVRKEVEEWIPPTEEHEGIKKFALEQIDMSMTKQKYLDEYLEKSKEEFDDSDEAVQKYINDNIQYCKDSLDRAYKSWKEEIERTEKKNIWIQKFLESIR